MKTIAIIAHDGKKAEMLAFIKDAHRYRNLNPQPPADEAKYLALYEIDAEDPTAVVRQIEQDDRTIRIPQGRMIDCIRLAWGSGAFQHVTL